MTTERKYIYITDAFGTQPHITTAQEAEQMLRATDMFPDNPEDFRVTDDGIWVGDEWAYQSVEEYMADGGNIDGVPDYSDYRP